MITSRAHAGPGESSSAFSPKQAHGEREWAWRCQSTHGLVKAWMIEKTKNLLGGKGVGQMCVWEGVWA